MVRYTIIFPLLLIISLHSRSQGFPGMDSLTVALGNIVKIPTKDLVVHLGDIIPAAPDLKIVNYKRSYVNISDFRGKLLILDFWNQWCTDCIKLMPELEALQKRYGDRIMILPVNMQSKRSTLAFYEKMEVKGTKISNPSVVEDTILHKMFPAWGNPHEVWIDPNGKVIGITSSRELKVENIDIALKGEDLNLPDYTWRWNFDPHKPLAVGAKSDNDANYYYRSVFTEPIYGAIRNLPIIANDSNYGRIFLNNLPIISMYLAMYSRLDTSFQNLYPQFDGGKEGAPWIYKSDSTETYGLQDWLRSDTMLDASRQFCYELIIPGKHQRQNSLLKWAIQDIDRFCKMHSSLKRIKIPCFVLKKANSPKPLEGEVKNISYPMRNEINSNGYTHFIDIGIGDLCRYLNLHFAYYRKFPFIIDETGFKEEYNITIDIADNMSATDLKQQFNKLGMNLSIEQREIKVLLLRPE